MQAIAHKTDSDFMDSVLERAEKQRESDGLSEEIGKE